MRAHVQRLTMPGFFSMRRGAAAIIVSAVLFACNQDGASSNEDRDTHMGAIRAVAPPSADSAPVPAVAPPMASGPPVAPAEPSAAPAAGSASAARDAGPANAARSAGAPTPARPASSSSGAPSMTPETKKP